VVAAVGVCCCKCRFVYEIINFVSLNIHQIDMISCRASASTSTNVKSVKSVVKYLQERDPPFSNETTGYEIVAKIGQGGYGRYG
jgi:hypothetical protein